jgi:DNA-binding NtrC family response regulator
MRTLIIDDEEYVRLVLEQALREEGCEVTAVTHGAAGIEALQTSTFECVITDLRMPGLDGRAVLKWVREHQPDVDVLMLTGHGDVKDAVEAIKQGAWDFLVKDTPFEAAAVKAALARLNTVRALRKENLAARYGGFTRDVIIEGPSQAWQKLKIRIAQVAPSNAAVLIQGETGSGKEIAARLLHDLSRRTSGPFLAVNCGAVSRELLESELFGHEKGSFTGAIAAKPGLIAAAEGGTLFLDELGEMPGPMQVSLLRFLDRGEYRPVGSKRQIIAPGRDRYYVRETSRYACGSISNHRMGSKRAPRDDGSIGLQRQTVQPPGGDGHGVRRTTGRISLAPPIVAPSDDGSIGLQR